MALVDVRVRLESLSQLVAGLGAAERADAVALEQLIDAARWTRTYVDLELAFQRHVSDLRDEPWRQRWYDGEASARRLFLDFHLAARPLPAEGLRLQLELRNLRARLDGLIQVAEGWWHALVEAPTTQEVRAPRSLADARPDHPARSGRSRSV